MNGPPRVATKSLSLTSVFSSCFFFFLSKMTQACSQRSSLCLLVITLCVTLLLQLPAFTHASSASPSSSSSSSSSPHVLASTFTPFEFRVGVMLALTSGPNEIAWDRRNPNNPNVTIENGPGLQIFNAFNFAIDEVNKNPKYNKWFKIASDVYDDQWFPPRGFFGALDLIENAKSRLLVGPTTSGTTVNAHVVASKYQVPVFGVTASSPDLSNKVLYQNFFRICQSDASQASAMAWLVANKFNWPRVATLATQDSYGSSGINSFSVEARRLGVNIVTAQTVPLQATAEKLDAPLSALKSSRAKIIIYFGQDNELRSVMSSLSTYGLDSGDVVWFVADASVDDTVATQGNRTGFIGVRPDPGFGTPLIERWIDRFMARPSDKDTYLGMDRWAPRTRDLIHYSFFGADTGYLVAEVLYDLLVLSPLGLSRNATLPDDATVAAAVNRASNFTQADLFAAIRRLDMQGITGRVNFDKNQDRGDLRFQLLNGKKTAAVTTSDPYGTVKFLSAGVYQSGTFAAANSTIIWRDGSNNVPLAAPVGSVSGTGSIPPSANLSSAELGVLQAVTVILLLAVIGLMGLVWFARTSRVFHAASPKMMFVMLTGIALVLSSAIANNVNQSTGSCTARLWLFNLGFSAAFGSLFLKTFRVWKIFSNERLMVKALNDIQLLQILAVMVSYDLVLLIVHTAVAPYKVELYSDRCVFASGDQNAASILTILLTIGKALMVVGGAILTIKTKDLPSLYNETTYIALLIYNVGVIGGIYLAIRYGLNLSDKPSAITIIETIFILVCSFFACLVLFVPKVRVYFGQDHKMHAIKRAQAKRASVHGNAAGRQSVSGTGNGKRTSVQNSKAGSTSSLNANNKGGAGAGAGGAEDKKTPEQIQEALTKFLQEQESCLTAVLADINNLNKKLAEQKERVNQLTDLIFSVQMEKDYFEEIGGDMNLEEINRIFIERMQRLSNSSQQISKGGLVSGVGNTTAAPLRRPSSANTVDGPAGNGGSPNPPPSKAPPAKLDMSQVRKSVGGNNSPGIPLSGKARAPSVSYGENTTMKGSTTGNHTPNSSRLNPATKPPATLSSHASVSATANGANTTAANGSTAGAGAGAKSATSTPSISSTGLTLEAQPSAGSTLPSPALGASSRQTAGTSILHPASPVITSATAEPTAATVAATPVSASIASPSAPIPSTPLSQPTSPSLVATTPAGNGTAARSRGSSSVRSASPRTVRIHMG